MRTSNRAHLKRAVHRQEDSKTITDDVAEFLRHQHRSIDKPHLVTEPLGHLLKQNRPVSSVTDWHCRVLSLLSGFVGVRLTFHCLDRVLGTARSYRLFEEIGYTHGQNKHGPEGRMKRPRDAARHPGPESFKIKDYDCG